MVVVIRWNSMKQMIDHYISYKKVFEAIRLNNVTYRGTMLLHICNEEWNDDLTNNEMN